MALDSNGNDTTGTYYGRSPPMVLYRIEYADGAWQAFWGPGKRIDLLARLHTLYRKATIEIGQPIELQFGPNIDHAHEQPINFNAKPIEPKPKPAVAEDKPRSQMGRGERWKAIRDKRHPRPPEALEHSRQLQQRLNELANDRDTV